jgi:hypothetical protein
MNNLAKRPSIDPEYAQFLEPEVHEKGCTCPGCTHSGNAVSQSRDDRQPASATSTLPATASGEDDVEAILRIAEESQGRHNRKQFADGSFDQVEHDVSNVGRMLKAFLFR